MKQSAIACYADGAREIDALIAVEMRAAKLTIDDDAREHLSSLLGADRALSRQELVKLATYMHGAARVTLADVEAICGDAAEHSLDDLVDAVFEGDLESADSVFQTLLDSGTAPDRMISVASQHAARLAQMRIQMDGGRRSEDVVRGARPQIFFKRQPGMIRQLGAWELEGLGARRQCAWCGDASDARRAGFVRSHSASLSPCSRPPRAWYASALRIDP